MPTSAAVSTARRSVRAVLAHEAGTADHWQWRGGVRPEEFLDAVAEHRVAPVLAGAAADLRLPEDVAGPLQALRRADRLEAMVLIRSTAAVADQLAAVDHLFLKGPALGVQTTGEATARGGGDIDVVVRPDDLGAAVDRLLAAGWSVRDGYTVDRRTWAWRHQLRATYELGLEGSLGRLDLHWRLDPTYSLPSFDELWSRHVLVDIGPLAVRTLGGPDAFAHALRHAAKDGWSSLRSLVDVARLARVPGNWPTEPDRLDRLDRATLSVVDATVGLPPSAPRFRSTASGIPLALRTQVQGGLRARFPGDGSLRFTRYLLASGHGRRDLLTAVSVVALPPALTADIDAEGTLPGMAAALRRRVAYTLSRPRESR
ncbi:MAG TPA: nucleotidyltransferase family protein [Nocardioides sp.]|nr:nucleotidyltransferase family protein [Nocardioides sp.]